MNEEQLSRRDFLASAAAICASGCLFSGAAAKEVPVQSLDAGPVSRYAAEGVYDDFREQGCFIVRRGARLIALSSLCTHRTARLQAQPDHSFVCNRHGSTFAADGHVTNGPAKRDLPVLATSLSAGGHLLVAIPRL